MASSRVVPDPLSLDEQVCFAMVVATRSMLSMYRPVLEPLGLTHPQYLVMLALWDRRAGGGPPMSVKDLSNRLELDPGTLSPLLKRLEAGGLIRRERDRTDERMLAVALTDQGVALRERALAVPPAIVSRLGIEADGLEDLHRSLTRVIQAGRNPDRTQNGAVQK